MAKAMANVTSEEELQLARQVLVGAIWTEARAYARKKLVESLVCDYCQQENKRRRMKCMYFGDARHGEWPENRGWK